MSSTRNSSRTHKKPEPKVVLLYLKNNFVVGWCWWDNGLAWIPPESGGMVGWLALA
jgi:hypothetical protein